MRSIFGWSLPPGVTRLPGDEPDPPMPCEKGWPRCACGALLRMEPDTIPDAPERPPCKRHGTNYTRCEELERLTVDVDPEGVPAEIWEETRGCLGYWVSTFYYRQCRKCQAITREEVM